MEESERPEAAHVSDLPADELRRLKSQDLSMNASRTPRLVPTWETGQRREVFLVFPYPLAQVFGSNPSNWWAGGSRIFS